MSAYITPNDPALFGAADGQTIQNAIAEAVRCGCRQVRIPRYNLRTGKMEWRIEKAIRLPSDFTLILDNCYMVQETGIYDHMFMNENAWQPEKRTLEEEQHHITIRGEGNVILSGGEHNGLLEKTSMRYGMPMVWHNTMFYWENVRELRVENLYIERHRWWAMTHLYCRNVTLRNIEFFAAPHVPNMDGIDLRVGCHDFLLENITGRTGDDTIACTALSGRHERACAVPGKESHIHDVHIRNVMADPFLHLIVRLLNQDGNQLYNIYMDSLFDASNPFSKRKRKTVIGIGTPGNLYTTLRHVHNGETRQIHAKNLYSRGSIAVRFDESCEDSTFTNVKTWGDNVLGISTMGLGCQLKNILFDHFYYGSSKLIHQWGSSGNLEGYVDTVVALPNTWGDITLRHVYVGHTLRRLTQLGGKLTVTMEACQADAEDLCVDKGEATLILNGKEI